MWARQDALTLADTKEKSVILVTLQSDIQLFYLVLVVPKSSDWESELWADDSRSGRTKHENRGNASSKKSQDCKLSSGGRPAELTSPPLVIPITSLIRLLAYADLCAGARLE